MGSRNPLVYTSPVPGLQTCATMPIFFFNVGVETLNSGSNTLLIELCPPTPGSLISNVHLLN